jgi:hypothetical protein
MGELVLAQASLLAVVTDGKHETSIAAIWLDVAMKVL